MSELNTLFPVGKQISIKDENLTLKPFKFGELPKVFKAIETLSGTIGVLMRDRNVNPASITTLIAEGGDGILELMVIGSKKDKSWIEDLEMDEGVDLLTAIIEVNADFFIQKVLPTLNKTLEKSTGRT